jgi:hypothetical protein
MDTHKFMIKTLEEALERLRNIDFENHEKREKIAGQIGGLCGLLDMDIEDIEVIEEKIKD